MKTLAVLSQKGGSGKATISLNLAIAATLKTKSVVIIDLDPQQSAARWSRLRAAETPVILPGHGPNLADLIERDTLQDEENEKRGDQNGAARSRL